jgi:ABC-type Zn2+ transport system substrate-binding protein/surface adhesin
LKTKCRLSHWRERKKEKKEKKENKKGKKRKKKKEKQKNRKIHKKKRKRHVTVLQFVPDHRYAIHVWKIVPINHAVVICSDIFSHVYGLCRFHMFINGSC